MTASSITSRDASRKRAVSLQRNLAEAWLILAAVEQDSGKMKSAARYYRSYLESATRSIVT